MLLMRGEEIVMIPVVGIVFGTMYLFARLRAAEKEREQKVRMIEEVLKAPQVDPQVRDALLAQLQGKPQWQVEREMHLAQHGHGSWAKFLFTLGWLGLFVGLGVLVAGLVGDEPDMIMGGMVVGLIAFGLVTLPIAMREVEARRSA
jgi:hypothetical protein